MWPLKNKHAAQSLQHGNLPVDLPYIDWLLERLDEQHPVFQRSFGSHVHFGYWPEPAKATHTPDDFANATERLTREICLVAGVHSGQRILDVGCGFGGTIASLNERLSEIDLTGLNIDDRQLARARATVIPQAGNRVSFQQGDACALPFADACFDVVLAVESIHHFRDRLTFLREAARVLRPGGCLVLSDFVPTRYIHFKSRSFYGPINLRCSTAGYGRLAAQAGLVPLVQRDVTVHTIPTYQFLRTLEHILKHPLSFRVQTRLMEGLSRLHLLRYMILSFGVESDRT